MIDATRGALFGVPLDLLTMDETVQRCVELIETKAGAQHVVLNAGKVVLMSDRPDLAEIVSACEIVNADGQSIVWVGRLLGLHVPERVTGIDLMARLLGEAQERQWRVYFLGATDQVLQECVERVQEHFPNLSVCGQHHGYFEDWTEMALVVARSKPDVLLVGMPSPVKEYLLSDWRMRLPGVFAMGVGGSFDIWAGKSRRAPVWMQRLGLEWAYRLSQEPRRMWRRYALGNTRFAWLVLKELARRMAG